MLGDAFSPYIAAQNALVARLSFLIALCDFRQIFWIIEQPASSIMFSHPLLSFLMEGRNKEQETYKAAVDLGGFSLQCVKRLMLVGSAPWLAAMSRPMTRLERLALRRTSLCVGWPRLYSFVLVLFLFRWFGWVQRVSGTYIRFDFCG